MLHLESGGRKKGCALFEPSSEWAVISAESLPNPYSTIKKGDLKDELELLQCWISERAPGKWKRIVKKCVDALNKGMHVRVQCAGGQHRSYSIVEAVARKYSGSLTVVHRDRKV
tara:strand:- start:162 stop:503 length:342 start_codon:yes stop_codon:yes gene_type:complete